MKLLKLGPITYIYRNAPTAPTTDVSHRRGGRDAARRGDDRTKDDGTAADVGGAGAGEGEERARFLCVEVDIGVGIGIGIGGSTVFDGGRSGGNDDGDGRWWV